MRKRRERRFRPIRNLLRKAAPLAASIAVSACVPAKPAETNHPAVQRNTKEARRVKDLLGLLDSKDPDIRFEAAYALWKKAETDPQLLVKHIPKLFAALKSKDREVSLKVSRIITSIGKPAVPFLIKGLGIAGMERALSLLLLTKIGKPAVPELLQALDAKDAGMKRLVVYILGVIGDARALPTLRRLARDESIREEAEDAIRKISGK